jgi:hypothetical protein
MRLASLRTAAAAALALGLSGPLATPPDDPHPAGAAGGWGPREIRPRSVGLREGVGPCTIRSIPTGTDGGESSSCAKACGREPSRC